MKLRYKKNGEETHSSRFNMQALAEVLTGDDSVFFSDLDVYIEAKNEWVDMREAFASHDIITDNYNSCFFEPVNEEDRQRGYTL